MPGYARIIFRALRIAVVASLLPLFTLASSAVAEDLEYHNNIAIFYGGATEFSDDRRTSGLLGVEYERRFNPLWGIAGFAEASVSDFKRSHLLGIGGTLRPFQGGFRLAALVCAEYLDEEEFAMPEEAESGPEFLVRAAMSYEFELGRITIEPAVAVDFAGETDTILNYGFALGYDF